MKRFWTAVAVTAEGNGHGIALDGRPVRTPGRAPLAVPGKALAQAIADEWRAVYGAIDPRAMPLTGLANAAIDRIAPDRDGFAQGLAKYGESDLLYYRSPDPPALAQRQAAAWNPPLNWAERTYGVQFEIAQGVMHRAQPMATIAALGQAIGGYDAFRLAALSPIVTVTGSLVLALALAEQAIDPDTAWAAARIDEDWQIEHWGEDELAAKATAAARVDFNVGARFLTLLDLPATA